MFNTQHVLYMVISGIVTAALLVLAKRCVREDLTKNRILQLSAILTVAIHYSNLWVNFFVSGGNAAVENNHILPVYPCNVVMWMLLIASLLHNKKSLLFRFLSEFCLYGGVVCATVGIVFNANFDNIPTLANYDVLKGLLSHSTMLFGCLYLFAGGYIRISAWNALSVAGGLGIFVLCGLGVNALYEACGMTAPDGMFLRSNPYIDFSPMILGLVAVVLLFAVLALWELRLPVEQRWYSRFTRRASKESRKHV